MFNRIFSASRILLLIPLILIYSISFCSAEGAEKNILVMLPHTPEFPLHTAFNRGLKTQLQESGQYKFTYSFEYFGLAHYATAEYYDDTARFFQAKYAKRQPDLIVAAGETNDFILQYGQKVFPGVPVIVIWPQDKGEAKGLPPEITAVYDAAPDNYESNIQTILRINPATSRIYIVIGDSVEEQKVAGGLQAIVNKYSPAKFVFLNKLPYAEMMESIRQARADEAVLFIRWVADAEGRSYIPEQVLEAICRNAQAPVYAIDRHTFGTGIVGGHLYNYETVGKKIAGVALDILTGKNPAADVIASAPSTEYVFDWRELKRWGIAEEKLPPDSIIEYKEASVWELYKWYIVAGIFIPLLEAALVFALLFNRARRKKAESKLMLLNTTLENRVSERTQELQDKNHQLKRAQKRLKVLNRRLDVIARTDSLTGLYNRRHMEIKTQEEYEAFLSTGVTFAILLVDIDYFKRVNDIYGHVVGDCLLRLISDDLKKLVRESDTVSRWGGEEFLLLLKDCNYDRAGETAERIRRAVAEKVYTCQGISLSLTLTVGISVISGSDTVEDAVKGADYALYKGKQAGRNRVVCFDNSAQAEQAGLA